MRSAAVAGSVAALFAMANAVLPSCASAGPPCSCLSPADDFNGDGKTDLIRANASSIRIDLLDGTNNVTHGLFPNGGGSLALKGVGNLNMDGSADFVTQGGGVVRVTFVNAAGTGTLGSLYIADGGGAWHVVDVADTNGDGVDEIIFEGTGAAAGAVRIANIASGTPVFSYLATAGGTWSYALSADLNGDSRADLLFRVAGALRANFAGGAAIVKYFSQGGGAWTLRASGDFDGNGTEDLVDVPNPASAGADRIRLFDENGNPSGTGYVSNGGGSLTLRTTGDVTGDGKDDLAYDGPASFVIVPMNGAVPGTRFFPSNGGGLFTLRRLGDTNGDGFEDLITTNAAGDVWIQLANFEGHMTTAGTVPDVPPLPSL